MTIGRIPSVEGGIQPTIVDAKGDLIAAVAADSVNRLAVGSNDQVLVADSAASTGLAWKSYGAQFVAGKNKIINGDFGVWQRGTSFSNPSNDTFSADRFKIIYDGSTATRTISRQTFTPGTAPVAGYEGSFFWRSNQSVAGSGASYFVLAQLVEDVRTFAGQTVTFSFWAKADATRNISANIIQNFGSGGSAEVFVGQPINVNLTTGWVRYSGTITVPSISGKTIGTNSFVKVEIALPVNTTYTIDIWGWQLEAGSVATPFTTATGTIQGELAACQRYYAVAGATTLGAPVCMMTYTTSSRADGIIELPVTMRTAPTLVATSGTNYYTIFTYNGAYDFINSVTLEVATTKNVWIKNTTEAASPANGAGGLLYVENASGSIAFSAEL
jgi:hypothetical protein